ncbi:MAG TPA: hypothetical protein ACFCUD_11820 [Cyclobacteriaceae bacterium]
MPEYYKFLLFFFIINTSIECCAQELVLAGVYKGERIFIQNPYNGQENRFCVKEVKLNNERLEMDYQMSALEVDFENVKKFSPVIIKIYYHNDRCKPHILNPDAIRFYNTFRFLEVGINDTIIYWTTSAEKPGGKYLVEALNYDFWEPVGDEIESKGNFSEASYQYYPSMTEGANKFRIKYIASDGAERYSQELEHVFYPEPIKLTITDEKLILSRATEIEITTKNNIAIYRDVVKELPIVRLPPGEYYVFIVEENRSEVFIKN